MNEINRFFETEASPAIAANTINRWLMRWAVLEPDRIRSFCPAQHPPFDNDWLIRDGQRAALFSSQDPQCYPLLQSALQEAIAAKGCPLRLENDSNGWHVSIRTADSEKFAQSSDIYPAMAMLEAWVSLLYKIEFHLNLSGIQK